MAIKAVTRIGKAKLKEAGLTPEQIAICNKRYMECPHKFSCSDWVKGYIQLNVTNRVEGPKDIEITA